jgi:hypothetical protein
MRLRSIAEGTLPFRGEGLTNVREKAGMGRAKLRVVHAGFIQAELAVDGEANFRGVIVLLAVIFPPANGTQLQGAGGIESLISTARTTKAHFHSRTHAEMDVTRERRITRNGPECASLRFPYLFG